MTPGHQISISPSIARVEVWIDGSKIAESDRAVLLDETGLPTRYYLPLDDVEQELLRPSDSTTTCPFKGEASYWSVEVDGKVHADLVWTYREPIPEREVIRGLVSFYNERVDLVIDGRPQVRPETPYSPKDDDAS
jgi:uncharacterized protein (DUF427 family)